MIRCKIIYYDKTRSEEEYMLSLPSLNDLEVSNLPAIMISELIYQDLPPDADEYEETSIKIKNSKDVDVKWITGDVTKLSLQSAELEIEFDNDAQEERFYDKDWENEWIMPVLAYKLNNKTTELTYSNGLFTLEIL